LKNPIMNEMMIIGELVEKTEDFVKIKRGGEELNIPFGNVKKVKMALKI